MDNNKLIELKKIGFKVVDCCGTCINSRFEHGREFGTCGKYTYAHLKHGNVRQLSIHRYGKCKDGYKRMAFTGELKIFSDYF